MVSEKPAFMQQKPHTTKFIQLIGPLGTGCRRLALDFIQPSQAAAWITMNWNLYAPVLWKMAEDHGTHLLGIEYSEKKEFRALCKTLLESQIFDAWILDGLKLTQAEGMFLHKLLRLLPRPQRVLILDAYPHSFCQERIHIHLSHQKYRLTWSKGGPSTPQYKSSPLLSMTEDTYVCH
ncbi:MAG: hypothetical protein JWQ35_1117 [Bacteriovoracaceae bacterium]|nr:hypothetical protein [Bacteriovoracaceae bacterium]